MAEALNVIRKLWQWLERQGADRALNEKRIAEYVERRRRDLVRRAASRIGSY